MSQLTETLVEIAAIVGACSSVIGGMSALMVDFFRRRVNAKNFEYAMQNDFQRIENAVELLQSTLESHSAKSAINHLEISQRVARLEGKYNVEYSD